MPPLWCRRQPREPSPPAHDAAEAALRGVRDAEEAGSRWRAWRRKEEPQWQKSQQSRTDGATVAGVVLDEDDIGSTGLSTSSSRSFPEVLALGAAQNSTDRPILEMLEDIERQSISEALHRDEIYSCMESSPLRYFPLPPPELSAPPQLELSIPYPTAPLPALIPDGSTMQAPQAALTSQADICNAHSCPAGYSAASGCGRMLEFEPRASATADSSASIQFFATPWTEFRGVSYSGDPNFCWGPQPFSEREQKVGDDVLETVEVLTEDHNLERILDMSALELYSYDSSGQVLEGLNVDECVDESPRSGHSPLNQDSETSLEIGPFRTQVSSYHSTPSISSPSEATDISAGGLDVHDADCGYVVRNLVRQIQSTEPAYAGSAELSTQSAEPGFPRMTSADKIS